MRETAASREINSGLKWPLLNLLIMPNICHLNLLMNIQRSENMGLSTFIMLPTVLQHQVSYSNSTRQCYMYVYLLSYPGTIYNLGNYINSSI